MNKNNVGDLSLSNLVRAFVIGGTFDMPGLLATVQEFGEEFWAAESADQETVEKELIEFLNQPKLRGLKSLPLPTLALEMVLARPDRGGELSARTAVVGRVTEVLRNWIPTSSWATMGQGKGGVVLGKVPGVERDENNNVIGYTDGTWRTEEKEYAKIAKRNAEQAKIRAEKRAEKAKGDESEEEAAQ